MPNSLNEKVAIVTGGGSGIGEGLCRELARRGARVVVADINSAEAGRVAASITGAITGIGGQAAASTGDVSRAEEVTRLVEETAAAYGRLDYMFNNAGFAIGGDFRDLTLEHWHRVLDVDFYGVLHGMQAAYPVMVRQGFGHIVNTSSAAAFFATPGNAPYCAAKYATASSPASATESSCGRCGNRGGTGPLNRIQHHRRERSLADLGRIGRVRYRVSRRRPRPRRSAGAEPA
jgi:NAD(P)-dependent dehydrogenase (short-subunit alcohol dehydrogenase family)